jgi:hypothetical protein
MSWKRDWQVFNKDVIEQFRTNGGQVPGRKYPVILLTTTGAKTGRHHTTPLNYSMDGDRMEEPQHLVCERRTRPASL